MRLIKTSLINGIAIFVKIFAMLGLNKILALYIGPSSYAVIGQFQNLVQFVVTFSSGALTNGVTLLVAETNSQRSKQKQVIRTAGMFAFIFSLLAMFLVLCLRDYLAVIIFHSKALSGVFIWFGLSLLLLSFNALLLAVLNGKKLISQYVMANIAGSVFALVITSILLIEYGLYGALIGLGVYQALSFFVTLFICMQNEWFSLRFFLGKMDWIVARRLSTFAGMALVSASVVPLSHILVRSHIAEHFGWEVAGYWEALWRLSLTYLMFVTTTLSLYYLPKMAELSSSKEIIAELINGFKLIIPVILLFAFMIYTLRRLLIQILFSSEFEPVTELFTWQVIGDFFKICNWLLAFVMLTKSMSKSYIFCEAFSSFGFYFSALLFSHFWGVKGVIFAYAVVNFVALFLFATLLYIQLKRRDSKSSTVLDVNHSPVYS